MHAETLPYRHNDVPLHGHLVSPDGIGPSPGILVLHTALGISAHEKLIARRLAALGYVALVADDREAALQHYARADEHGCDDARVYLNYGRLAFRSGQAGLPAKLLRKALDLKPREQDVLYELSMALYSAREYGSALSTMALLKDITPEQAPEFFVAMATCAHLTGSDKLAKAAAGRALEAARDDAERSSISAKLEFLNQPAIEYSRVAPLGTGPRGATIAEEAKDPGRPRIERRAPKVEVVPRRTEGSLERVEGLLVQVDCLGEEARLWIQSGEKKIGLLISKGSEVVALRGGETIIHDFECGPQKSPAKVVARCESRPGTVQGLEGVVKTLEFQ